MAASKRNTMLDLPVRFIFTDEGTSFFIKNKKPLNKFTLADEVHEYGLFLQKFSPASIQQMMLINYISQIELSVVDYAPKRQDILDLSKLVVYGLMYKGFDKEVFELIVRSTLTQQWNRENPKNTFSVESKPNETAFQAFFNGKEAILNSIKDDILQPIHRDLSSDQNLLADEKNIQIFLSEKFCNNLRKFNYFILAKYKGSNNYLSVVQSIRDLLKRYMAKCSIAEYLSLMLLELIGSAQNLNMHDAAKESLKSRYSPRELQTNPELRSTILKQMEQQHDYVHVNWSFKNTSTGSRLRLTLFNRKTEYQKFRKGIEDKRNVDSRNRSLTQFYGDISDEQVASDLGMYYLTYLNDACRNVHVKFETSVTEKSSSGLTVVTLSFTF